PRSCFFRKNRRGDNYPDTGGKWQLLISRAFPAIDKLGSSVLPNLFGSTYIQSDIKKPACGRLLVGDSYLFLINRNRLQQVRP
ncbi:hypothetical protein BUE61_27550, partial [Pseudomonas syringae pv. actinidiae]